MLTRKRISLPVYSGDARRDFEALKRSISAYLLALEAKQSLTLDSATGLDNTPVGVKTASTGAFTTLSASGTLTASGLVDASGSGAGQIKFPATQNASADANTLDDYEEGTWTPTVTAGSGTFTSVSATGRYQKIGNRVYWNSRVTITTNGSAAGYIQLTLPFTAAQPNAGIGREVLHIGTWVGVIGGANVNWVLFVKLSDSTYPGETGTIFDLSGHFEV